MAAGADFKERPTIEAHLKNLISRFENLTESAAARMDALQQAVKIAKKFQDKMEPLNAWLDATEKTIKDMELVPTDEEKIQEKINEHSYLHKDILMKKHDFSELTDIASTLMGIVGEDEANLLTDKLQSATDRYTSMVKRSESLTELLRKLKKELRHLVLTYQDLQAWMGEAEMKLSEYSVISIHTDRLLQQIESIADLAEEISSKDAEIASTTDSGLELIKHISNNEAIQLKDKLDSMQRRYNDLVQHSANLLKQTQEILPLVQQFFDNRNLLADWMQGAESTLQLTDPPEEKIFKLEIEISEYRTILDKINAIGPQLYTISPGESAATIRSLITRDNRKFDTIAEQIQRKTERIQLNKQRSFEIISDIDDLLEWFRVADNQLREAEPPSSDFEIIRVQLKEHKAFNDDICSQKSRVRDVISNAKKVIRENIQHEDTSSIRDKVEDLREFMEIVCSLSADRLGVLEQALPLAEHFKDTHIHLVDWLEEAEQKINMLAMPALRLDLIAIQQDKNEQLLHYINDHKPIVDKLNKTGELLVKLCNDEEGAKIVEILESDNARFKALRVELRSRQQSLEQALQESSQFSAKLEGLSRALINIADQVNDAEPVSAHPSRLRDQLEENTSICDDIMKRSDALKSIKAAANEMINKAGNHTDPAIQDIQQKLEKLNKLWTEVQKSTKTRGQTLDYTLVVAEKFWFELNEVMSTLRELQDTLSGQTPAGAQPGAIQQQQSVLQEIRQEIDQAKPEVEQVRASGHELMGLCGDSDQPEVRKHIEDLDHAWDTITTLYAKREEDLICALEKAMEFHDTLHGLSELLKTSEQRFAKMGVIANSIDDVKLQIDELAKFKNDIDPHMVKVGSFPHHQNNFLDKV